MAEQVTTGILEDLAQVIVKSGLPRDEIARALRIDESVLGAIVNGGTCSLQTLDCLCGFFGLGLRPRVEPPHVYSWSMS